MTDDLHVIFGGGQVGQPLARILGERGLRVRMVKRSAGAPEGIELMQGDATDPNFRREAARGAATVYHCMNPPYSARIWADVIPKYINNLIAAAGSRGARLVVLESVYMLGRTGRCPMNEDTPMNPCSRKGEIRAREVERLFDAHRRGEMRATVGRASDYYGTGATMSHLGSILETGDRRRAGTCTRTALTHSFLAEQESTSHSGDATGIPPSCRMRGHERRNTGVALVIL